MNTNVLTQRIEVAKAAVMAQTGLMHRGFGSARSLWKSDGTRVTPVDLEISSAIAKVVESAFPEDQFFSEELVHEGGPIELRPGFSWMLDPIDGTNNYALGLAPCAIALALFENGEPIYGVVYDHSRETLIHGGPGIGAWDGNRPAKVLDVEPNSQSLVGFHSPFDRRFSAEAQRVIENYKIRGLGSSTLHLAYVAAGLLEGVVDHNVKLWDIAAAIPIVRAAGGELRFRGKSPLPLRAFDLSMQRIQYIAGSSRMCDHLSSTVFGP